MKKLLKIAQSAERSNKNMKKLLSTFLFFVSLAIVFVMTTACTPSQQETLGENPMPRGGGNLPYRVWQSWDEMKEVLGDHYLYPTYLPEFAQQSEHQSMRSWFNNIDRELGADELFFGYAISYRGGSKDDSLAINATDFGRRSSAYDDLMQALADANAPYIEPQIYERFNEYTVTVGGIEISFFSIYTTIPPPEWTTNPDEWHTYHPRNSRRVHFVFAIDAVTYEAVWIQYNVEDKYADNEQRDGLLRVAKSIIEQVREIE